MRTILSFIIIGTILSSCGLIKNREGEGARNHDNRSPQHHAQVNTSPTSTTTTHTQKDRSIKEVVTDTRISAALHLDLAALKLYKPINATVRKGTVILTGTVSSEKDSLAAAGIAWKQNGVKKVINKIKVEDKESDSKKK